MAWQSLVSVNLDVTSPPGMCLAHAKDAVGAPAGVDTARQSWDMAQDKHPGDYNLPNVPVAVYWSWVGDLGYGRIDYGHVCIWVPGRGLFSSPKRWSDGNGSAWFNSIDEVSNWIGGSYLGWTSDINGKQIAQWVGDGAPTSSATPSGWNATYTVQSGDSLSVIADKYGINWNDLYSANAGVIGGNPDAIEVGQVLVVPGGAPAPAPAPAAPALNANQRVTGADGANRRAEASSQSTLLDPPLAPGEVGDFLGFTRGEDPYGNGNNIWFRGISGNYFYSGAFTDSSTNGLSDLDVVADPKPLAATVEHAPEVPTVVVPVEQLYPDLQPATPADPAPSIEPTVAESAPVDPTPTVKEVHVPTPATDEQLKTLLAESKIVTLDDPNAPIIPDVIAKPLWLVLALVSSSTPYAFGLTVINWGAWDANIATQAAALIVAWSGTLASVLGLSRFSKTSSK